MALTIVVRSDAGESPPQITFDAPRIVLGRGDGCEVRLPDPSVSHRHASIRQRGSDYIVVDEGSANGTFVGPVRLSPHAPRVLKDGDLVRVGRVWLEARIEQTVPTPNTAAATKELALALVAHALAAQGEAANVRVRVVEGPSTGAQLDVEEFDRAYSIGRMKTADLTLDDPDLSRRHVEILRRADRIIVRDLGSKNGSRLGETSIESKGEATWTRGERLVLGATSLEVDDPISDALVELEQAADEKIRADEAIDPPRNDPSVDSETGETDDIPIDTGPDDRARTFPRPRERATSGAGWMPTDYLVAILAIAVVVLSLVGLLWIVQSE